MIRALIAWSWLVSTTGAAVMYLPHLPLVVAQHVANAVRRDGL